MEKVVSPLFPIAALFLATAQCFASTVLLHGKVTTEDGSVPDKIVSIEQFCGDNAQRVAATNSKGEYLWRMDTTPTSLASAVGVGASFRGEFYAAHEESRATTKAAARGSCVLRASAPGYDSSFIDLDSVNAFSNPVLPPLVIVRHGSNPSFEIFTASTPPRSVARSWNRSAEALQAGDLVGAERELRKTLQAAPQFAEGWNALGVVLQNQNRLPEARDAYQHAVDTKPKLLPPYLLLARITAAEKDWTATAKAADGLIAADTKHRYLEIYLHQAIARFQLKDLPGAEASAQELIRLDKKHEIARAEYVLGLILAAKGDFAPAAERMQRFLDLEPKSTDASAARLRLADFAKGRAGEVGTAMESLSADLQLAPSGEAWVPGGIKALAAVAHVPRSTSYQTFFADYSRAIANESSPGTGLGIPLYLDTLRTYLAAVTELVTLGERREEGTRITLKLGDPATARVLTLFGWRTAVKGEVATIEPGDAPQDGVRQRLLALFNVDEIALQKALEAKQTFTIDIPSENARLIGGDAWSRMLAKDAPNFHGGLAEAFATDLRLARAYAGLGAMGPDAGTALVAGLGLRTVVTRYAEPLARYGDAFAVTGAGVALPGGADAEPAWKKLAGVPSRDPASFFRALIEKDQGKLAAFYFAISRGDPAHQRYFTSDPARTERFYNWYRDSSEFNDRLSMVAPSWRKALFQDLPLDATGRLKFPGGRAAWMSPSGSDDDLLVNLKALEALVPVASIESHRSVPLDARSAALLAQYYTDWRGIFPYFERLTGLERPEFEALEKFSNAAGQFPSAIQNTALGEWYSLVELIARGFEAGALNAGQSANAFRRVTADLTAPDASAAAIADLREIAGGDVDVRDAVARHLLRLGGERRAEFDRVMELQNVDLGSLETMGAAAAPGRVDSKRALHALSGLVYAAALDPSILLVSEDPNLVSKHRFALGPDQGVAMFAGAALVRSTASPGSYLTGSFAGLETIARTMAKSGSRATDHATGGGESAPSPALAPSAPADIGSTPVRAVFRASGRLVEVYATVTDSSGRYVDDLTAAQFAVMDQDHPQKIGAFESRFSQVSVTLLLDTTGSMQFALPALKNAALKLIDDLRPGDSVSVYSFSESVKELQSFTTDKDAAKRAVLRTEALGNTALYDAMTRVSRDLSGRDGKKVIVLFTDGDDNFSTLQKDAAIARAEGSGVPVFTIAEGEALSRPEFLSQLAAISKATGGEPFTIHNTGEIRKVFAKISEDLVHGYLFSFQPAPGESRDWRNIQVVLPGSKGYKVRAREGYLPE